MIFWFPLEELQFSKKKLLLFSVFYTILFLERERDYVRHFELQIQNSSRQEKWSYEWNSGESDKVRFDIRPHRWISYSL